MGCAALRLRLDAQVPGQSPNTPGPAANEYTVSYDLMGCVGLCALAFRPGLADPGLLPSKPWLRRWRDQLPGAIACGSMGAKGEIAHEEGQCLASR